MSAHLEIQDDDVEPVASYSGNAETLDDPRHRGGGKVRSVEGIYQARPQDFNVAWPTVRTETFVEMVFGSIQDRGGATYDQIVDDTGLDEDVVGVCLADLLIWSKKVRSVGEEYSRVYLVKE